MKIGKRWNIVWMNGKTEINQRLDVEAVALAGSLAQIVNYAHVEAAVNSKTYCNPLKVVPAKCANNAGLIGAALLFKEQNHD